MEYKLSELLKKYDTELDILFRNNKTKYSYRMAIKKFINANERCYRMNIDNLKSYFSSFRNEYSDSYYNIICSAVKIFYERVLNQSRKMNWFKPIKTEPQFRDIIRDDEFIYIMQNLSNIKHKCFTIILYSTGIRINELLEIKVKDINLSNRTIFIRSEKNGKNRYVNIHELTFKYLISYLKQWRPVEYLFEGQKRRRYSESSVRQCLKRASLGLNKNIYPHIFRHTFATKTIEKEDVFITMELLGHRSLKSTLHYNHISPERFKTLYNPLNNIQL